MPALRVLVAVAGIAATLSATMPQAASAASPTTTKSPTNQELKNEIDLLREQVNDLSTRTNWFIGGLSIVVVIGTISSLFGFIRSEQRATESFRIAKRGEEEAQGRAREVHEQFLGGSVQTLTLVNQTLGLAARASERAALVLQRKAEKNLADLDHASRALLDRVPDADDRALVAKQDRRSELISLAERIRGFEINSENLADELALTPHCLFVRGMHLHLSQQYSDAMESWQSVVHGTEVDPSLRSKTWYWIGYEENNLGDFGAAKTSFGHALRDATGARRLDLHRIMLESRFFDVDHHSASSLIGPLEELLVEAEADRSDGADTAQQHIRSTLGNVHHAAGLDHDAGGRTTEARDHWQSACRLFAGAPASEKWAPFGHAEALFKLGDLQAAENIFVHEVMPRAQAEFLARVEHRTKVLARSTQLICCLRVPRLSSRAESHYDNVTEALGNVDERLTVYSQLRRRNIKKKLFEEDLEKMRKLIPEARHPSEVGEPSPAGEAE